MKKRLISLVLAIAMVASTFPASALAEEVGSEQEPVPAVTETAPEEPAPEPEPEPATEPPAEAATEPETEPETEPVTEPATEPETEPETGPATEPVTEPAAVAATVTFICTPGELTLTVFPADANEQSAIKPQADGTYLLLPGDYVYLAAAEGYESARGRFTLPEQTPALTVEVTLTQSAPEQETEAPTEEATEAPTEDPTEAPTEEPTAPVPSAIPVSFACTPAELTLAVFPADADETAAIDPQADGTYLLLPGDYAYLAAAEGYEPLEGSFTVPTEAENFQVAVVLNVPATEEKVLQLDEGILDSGTCGENLTWTLSEDGVLTISGTGDMEDYTSHQTPAPWYQYKEQIVSIDMKRGITNIGADAFIRCSVLTNVIIPESVRGIGDYAFGICRNLTQITIPEGVTTIGSGTFSDCSALSKMAIPESVISIGSSAFGGCRSLTDIAIPEGITIISSGMFGNCNALTRIIIPLNVTTIGAGAFSGCSALTDIVIPESVTSIGGSAFYGCSSLTEVTLPKGITYIDDSTFSNCSSLTAITIPAGVHLINNYAFSNCNSLTTVFIPRSVSMIGTSAFWAEKLSTIYYGGSDADWKRISIQDGGTLYFIKASIHYNATHICTLTEVPAKAPSYDEDGNNAYWVCSDCGKVYKDANGSEETTVEAETLLKLPCVDHGTCGKNLTWVLTEDGVLTISGTGEMYRSGLNNAPWSAYKEQIVSVFVKTGATNIGMYAFCNLSALTDVTIPESVTGIDYGAFQNCTSLTTVSLPASISNIGAYSFNDCSALTDVVLSEGVTNIANSAFDGCTELTNITIPNSVTRIGADAFQGCISLTSVSLPANITSIASDVFGGCKKLSNVFIPQNVTSIGDWAFHDNNTPFVVYYGGSEADWDNISISSSNLSLNSAAIHCNSTHICTLRSVAEQAPTATQNGNHAYWLCSICQQAYKDAGGIAQTTVEAETIPAGTIAYGSCGQYLNWTLHGSGELVVYGTGSMTNYSQGSAAPWNRYRKDIVSLTVKDGVTSLGSYAFYSCYRLSAVSIAPSVAKIGENAFDSCIRLTDVVLPEGVTTISYSSFSGCTGLQSIVIPGSVTSIESAVFYNCSSLTGVTIPKDVTEIGNNAFYGCGSLTYVSIPEGVNRIGTLAFCGCGKLANIKLPESLTLIGGNAFADCTSLSSVIIPERATKIGDGVFWKCTGLTSVVLPSEIAYVPGGMFSGCTSLTAVTIPDSVAKIGNSAFEGCTSLTTIVVPEGVTTIEGDAFQNCTNLIGLLLPESLTSIGEGAFFSCTGLKVVYYTGEKADWDNIQIGTDNSSLIGSVVRCNATHICTLTEIPAKAPTYTEDGNNQYWVCSVCKQAYKDAWGKAETTVAAETIPGKPCIAAGTCGQSINWVLTEDGVMILSGSGGMESFAASGDAPWDAHRARITAVVIPVEITAIGSNAFDSCENLTAVCYAGTAEQWENVQIGSGNASLTGAPVRYNTDHMCLLTEVPAKEPTYIEDGHNAYWLCAICQKLYKDAQGTEETTAEAEAIPKLPSVAAGTCGENIIWALGEDGVMDVFGTGAMTSFTCVGNTTWEKVSPQIRSVVIAEGITKVDGFWECSNLTSVTIPNGVTEIGRFAFLSCGNLISVAIPGGVTSIGNQAFGYCGSLTRVFIPKSVTQIGTWVFDSCRNLTDVYYFGSETDWAKIEIDSDNSELFNATIHYDFTHVCTLTKVEAKAATETEDGCREYWVCPTCGLAYKDELGKKKTTPEAERTPAGTIACGSCGENISWIISGSGELTISGTGSMPSFGEVFGLDNAPWCEYREHILSATIEDGIVNVGAYAFYGCSSLTSVQIPYSVTSIYEGAFSGCSSLTNVAIPETVTFISALAFQNCTSLVNVNIPEAVTSIAGVFDGCTSLASIKIPDNVTSIYGAFRGCTSLTTIEIPDGVTDINNAFEGCSNLTSVNIPKSITSIGWSAFEGCSSLSKISIPEHITSIHGGAFRNCSSLTSITIPQGITSIEYETFSGCSGLTSINIPEGITTIGWSAFDGCSSLVSVTIPESVTSIGEIAFANCSSLTSVNIPAGITSIASVFVGCSSLTDIKIPDGVTDITSAFSDCTSLTNVEIPNSITTIGASAFEGCTSLTSLVIPNNVTSIEESAFSGSGLTSIVLPDGITTLANRLFHDCTELVSVTLPEGVTRIGEGVFENCRSLVSLTIPESVTSIGNYAFANCGSLTDITIPQGVTKIGTYTFSFCTQLSNVVLSDNITSIGTRAFDFCNQLTTVTIPQSVTSIGRYAFNGCRRLATVFYKGTEADWNSIRIDAGNLPLTGAEIRYISDHICELTEVPAKASTCTEEGNNRYWICSVCGKVYKDALGKVETTIEAETLPTKPAATTMAKVTGSEGSFTATWNAQKNVNGYAVQYATNSSFATCRTLMVYGARTTSKTVNGLAAGTYYVRVRTFKTVDSKKIYSLASPALTVTVGSTKPTSTTLTKVTAGDSSFTAAWNAQTNADGYALQYAADSSFASCKTVMVYGGDVASTTVKNLTAGTYYVRVRTFKTAGNSKAYSLASAAMTVTVGSTKPVTTTLTKVTGGDGSFTAAWNIQKNVDGYAVQYATDSSFASCKTVMVYGGDVASTTVKNLTAGTYYVRVRTFKTVDGAKNYSLASAYLTVTVK